MVMNFFAVCRDRPDTPSHCYSDCPHDSTGSVRPPTHPSSNPASLAHEKRRPATPRAFLRLRREARSSVDGEAVEMSRAAGTDEAGLGAIGAHMRRIPRRVVAAAAVRMTQHRLVI